MLATSTLVSVAFAFDVVVGGVLAHPGYVYVVDVVHFVTGWVVVSVPTVV
jgi:hypothetical protein